MPTQDLKTFHPQALKFRRRWLEAIDTLGADWSRSELANALNQNYYTCTKILPKLIGEGLIEKSGFGDHSITAIGRKARRTQMFTLTQKGAEVLGALRQKGVGAAVLPGEEL